MQPSLTRRGLVAGAGLAALPLGRGRAQAGPVIRLGVLSDFSGPYRRLRERKLVTEDSDQHQYRFQSIVDPESGRVLATLEHEVRSMRHPLYARPLVNRNPGQTNRHYIAGRDAWVPDDMMEEMDDPRSAARERRFENAMRRSAAE